MYNFSMSYSYMFFHKLLVSEGIANWLQEHRINMNVFSVVAYTCTHGAIKY